MTEKTRPPFILVIMADSQGCGWHRCQIPLASMVETGIADGRIDMQFWPDYVLLAARPDVIVFQRQVEDAYLDAMERWREMLPETLFVYELDDYLGEVPAASFHSGFMPPNIEEKIARGVKICDRVTTTTESLAEWFRSLGAADVRVVPNGLPAAKLREREPRQGGRLRVGFAGGMSHSGDLRIVEPAIREIGDEVEWVFFGTKPDDTGDVRIEFHEGLPAALYLEKMAQLDVDLMLAPLEDNRFNRCKSNLRLVEAGAVGACVVAQDMEPYRTNAPPVFTYADTPESWTKAIRSFMESNVAARRRSADAMRAWVGKHYVLERLMRARVDAWLPTGDKWKPSAPRSRSQPLVVACMEDRDGIAERMPFLRRAPVAEGLEAAVAKAIVSGSDVLWLRPTTSFHENSWNAMQSALRQAPNVASSVPLASDGTNAFPESDRWMPMAKNTVLEMERVLSAAHRGKRLKIAAPSGPCILLSAAALSMLGAPDVAGCDGNEEQAIMEWGLRGAMREWTHVQAADAFASSLAQPMQATRESSFRLQARGTATRLQVPSDSLTAVERESVELNLLSTQWGGPRPGSMGFGNDYEAWKSLMSAKAAALDAETAKPVNAPLPIVHVAEFGSAFAPFGWIVHVDESVTLDEDAVDALSAAIEQASEDVEVVYADHDTKLPDGRLTPEFKPDLDVELLLAQDYVTPVCAVRVNIPFDDRMSLYSHVVEIAVRKGTKAFAHIPRTLGATVLGMKPEEIALDALQRQVFVQDILGETATVSASKKVLGNLSIVRSWKGARQDAPLVSIVVPTLGSGRLIQPCVKTLLQHTDYPNYEIVVVQNGSRRDPELGAAADDPRVKVVRWEGGFNWSAINNWAIRFHGKGEYVATVNDDVNAATKGWLDAMMGHAVRRDVGVVGARLLHPMGMVQHVGVVAHRGMAGHMHKGLPNGQLGHMGRAAVTHEASAVTGACMLFSRATFDSVNGFDESMPRNYNDTDFCLRVRRTGLRNVVEMSAELLHPEGASREDQMSPKSLRLLASENKVFASKYPEADPYWNPNLRLDLVHGGLMIQGLNAEALSWSDFEAKPRQGRILVVNDLPGGKGLTLGIIRQGDIPMGADMSGFAVRLTGPLSRNAIPWDIRDPSRMREGLATLGVSRVVVRSLIGKDGAAPPVEALRCFAELDIDVGVDAIERWMVAPSDDGDPKVFGSVDREAWGQAYMMLMPLDLPDGRYEYSVTSIDSTEGESAGDEGPRTASFPIPDDAIGVRLYGRNGRLIADSNEVAE